MKDSSREKAQETEPVERRTAEIVEMASRAAEMAMGMAIAMAIRRGSEKSERKSRVERREAAWGDGEAGERRSCTRGGRPDYCCSAPAAGGPERRDGWPGQVCGDWKVPERGLQSLGV